MSQAEDLKRFTEQLQFVAADCEAIRVETMRTIKDKAFGKLDPNDALELYECVDSCLRTFHEKLIGPTSPTAEFLNQLIVATAEMSVVTESLGDRERDRRERIEPN